MIQILKHFGWTWVGLLVSDDDYGLHVAQSFQSDLAQSGGGCLAYLEVLPWDSDPSEEDCTFDKDINSSCGHGVWTRVQHDSSNGRGWN